MRRSASFFSLLVREKKEALLHVRADSLYREPDVTSHLRGRQHSHTRRRELNNCWHAPSGHYRLADEYYTHNPAIASARGQIRGAPLSPFTIGRETGAPLHVRADPLYPGHRNVSSHLRGRQHSHTRRRELNICWHAPIGASSARTRNCTSHASLTQ